MLRTRRLLALVATFVILGFGMPVLTYFLPDLIKSGASGLQVTVEQQTAAVAKALTAKYGVKIDMPRIKVQTKNLAGRMVAGTRQSISTREALDQLLSAYRQMGMMAAVLGLPEKAMGLEINGEPITLSLVSTKKMRGALGTYTATGRKIALPDRSNSFAHEWGHALDHYLAILSRNDEGAFLTRRMDTVGAQTLAPKAALVEAFAGIMNALYGDRTRLAALQLDLQRQVSQVGEDGDPTPAARQAMKTLADIREGRRPPAAYLNRYFASSDQFDKMAGAGGYFTDPAEMFARAVEAHVGRSVAAISDLPQDFLSKGEWGYDTDADPRLAMTFPRGIDAQGFSVAMVELSHAMSRIWLFGKDAMIAAARQRIAEPLVALGIAAHALIVDDVAIGQCLLEVVDDALVEGLRADMHHALEHDGLLAVRQRGPGHRQRTKLGIEREEIDRRRKRDRQDEQQRQRGGRGEGVRIHRPPP